MSYYDDIEVRTRSSSSPLNITTGCPGYINARIHVDHNACSLRIRGASTLLPLISTQAPKDRTLSPKTPTTYACAPLTPPHVPHMQLENTTTPAAYPGPSGSLL